MKEQLDQAVNMLKENEKYLVALSGKLLEENRLTQEGLEKILPPVQGKKI